MKITIASVFHPYKGGLATYNERLAQEFQKQGHEVKCDTFTLLYPQFLYPGKTQFSSLSAPTDLNIRQKISTVNPFNWIINGIRIFREKPDYLIFKYWLPFVGPCLGTIAAITRLNGKTKVICIADNIIPHEKRPGDTFFTKYFLFFVDRVVVMSIQVQEQLQQIAPKMPFALHPHPIFDSFGAKLSKTEAASLLQLPQEQKYILFFGFVREYKGLDLLLQAMSDSRVKELGIKLIIAGEYYQNRDSYDALIKDLDLQNEVYQYADFIPDNEVNRYFSMADLVVQPYKDATQSGVSQIAYHFCTPMVVTNVGGLPELVPDNKVGYVTEVNAKSVADAIVKYFVENKTAEFAENMQEEKKKYSWEGMVKTVLNYE